MTWRYQGQGLFDPLSLSCQKAARAPVTTHCFRKEKWSPDKWEKADGVSWNQKCFQILLAEAVQSYIGNSSCKGIWDYKYFCLFLLFEQGNLLTHRRKRWIWLRQVPGTPLCHNYKVKLQNGRENDRLSEEIEFVTGSGFWCRNNNVVGSQNYIINGFGCVCNSKVSFIWVRFWSPA